MLKLSELISSSGSMITSKLSVNDKRINQEKEKLIKTRYLEEKQREASPPARSDVANIAYMTIGGR